MNENNERIQSKSRKLETFKSNKHSLSCYDDKLKYTS